MGWNMILIVYVRLYDTSYQNIQEFVDLKAHVDKT